MTTDVVALDVETTTINRGHVYDPRNLLVAVATATASGGATTLRAADAVDAVSTIFKESLIAGFNFKFDLAWCKRTYPGLQRPRVWDCQLGEFILSNQTSRFPSLDETARKYGLEPKLDVVKLEYWDKGIDTDQIPWDVLEAYAGHDAYLTLQIYYKQQEIMTPAQKRLCWLQCQDMVLLQEMEENGLRFDEELCHVRAKQLDDKISEITTSLQSVYPHVPINFNSNDHLSAFLYGGTVKEVKKELDGFYKTGVKAGQPKYRNVEVEHQLPRLYTPLKGSEMAKPGNFAVDEGTLRKLKGKRKVLDQLLELAKLEKLNGTYYRGLVKLREEMNWEPGIIHGTFNQTTAQTGRLSSSKPNLQNFASELQDIFISRYTD